MKNKQYIIGVDGGNTKTDYLIYDLDGNFIDGIRGGTCSHEALADSFAGSYRVMKKTFDELLGRNQISIKQVIASVFGLAGVDVPFQKKSLESVVEKIGFQSYQVVNDGFLGIKAASPTGTGCCSINGTGTVNVGIDEQGNWMQVGGIGYVSGDEAGGSFLARRTVQAAYDDCFRYGQSTSLTNAVFKMYNINSKTEFTNAIVSTKIDSTYLIKALFQSANDGDQVAIGILEKASENMARSTAGVIAEINIVEPINIILAGSVWAKATTEIMSDKYKEVVCKLSQKTCNFILLELPPVLGAILWALEIALDKLPNADLKNKVLQSINQYQQQF